jgi:hypothetical protein
MPFMVEIAGSYSGLTADQPPETGRARMLVHGWALG